MNIVADLWKDYEILDAGDGMKLERWKNVILSRPDPQVIWKPVKPELWAKANAKYNRSKTGGGAWNFCKNMPSKWTIEYDNLKFYIEPTGFKHTGLFPEQAVNWKMTADIIRNAGRPVKVLNLFAYTGGATVACAKAGAQVTHVDAAKGMVERAGENARLSGIETGIRYIVDDCLKFVQREIRRGNKYDAIIMDPPSYGRGPTGEVWKIEDSVDELITLAASLLSDEPLFFLVNSYTTGLSPAAMQYILGLKVVSRYGGRLESRELGLRATSTGFAIPCGASARWQQS